TAGRTDLMGNSYVDREISHPVGFWHWKDIWMVAKAPRKNAGSRSRRTHDENWSVNLLVHFSVRWNPRRHSPFAMIVVQQPVFVASRSCRRSNGEDWEKRLLNLVHNSDSDSCSLLAPRTRD